MNIAIIGSGGDGAGMNECLYSIVKQLKKHNVILFYRGYQGIINNDIARLDLNQLKKSRKKGGIIIKSSRSTEFMTTKGFNKAIKNLNNLAVDLLIVMGGNGSLKGAVKLMQAGINVLFIPTTIDNDIELSDYCIGYNTAVINATDFVCKVDTSMQAFDRICIYEVMGRHCPDIANSVAKLTNAEYCYVNGCTFEDCLKTIKKAKKFGQSPKIILQENVIDVNDLKNFLTDNLKNVDVKYQIVGYVQRGGYATKTELKFAQDFAAKIIQCIKNNEFNKIICYNSEQNIFYAKNI